MENQTNEVKNKPSLEIKRLGSSAFAIDYDGTPVLITQQEYVRLVNNEKRAKKLQEDFIAVAAEMENLKSELIRTKKQAKELYEENVRLKSKLEQLTKLEAFKKRQGKGRPPVLTDEFKLVIRTFWGQKRVTGKGAPKQYSVMDIYRVLQERGYGGDYETVRKYIVDSKNNGGWL